MALNTDANLIARYEFDTVETVGLDTSPSALYTMTGGSNPATAVDGTRNRVMYCDGTTYLEKTTLFASPTAMTVSMWVKVDASSSSNEHVFMSIGNTVKLGVAATTPYWYAAWREGETSRVLFTASPIAHDGVWRHVVLTLTNSAQTFYINGASVGSATYNPVSIGWTWSGVTTTTRIGRGAVGGELPHTGYLDDVRVYSRVLDSTEVSALYAYAPTSLTISLCFAPWTRVLMANGCSRMRVDQLEPGMQLKGRDGQLTVHAVVSQPNSKIIRFDPKTLSSYQEQALFVTPHHLLQTRDGQWHESQDVRGGHALRLSVPMTVNHVVCREKWGMICAEGVWCETAAGTQKQADERRQFVRRNVAEPVAIKKMPVEPTPAPQRRRRMRQRRVVNH
jgi:hypothetical protein